MKVVFKFFGFSATFLEHVFDGFWVYGEVVRGFFSVFFGGESFFDQFFEEKINCRASNASFGGNGTGGLWPVL